MRVTVFCGSSPSSPFHLRTARHFGGILAGAGFTCVNGGGPGMMRALCEGAMEAGGQVHGVLLNAERYPPGHNAFTERVEFDELALRQKMLIDLGDAYVALPGGIGTMFEVLDVISRKLLGQIPADRPIILVDRVEFAALRVLLEDVVRRGFGYGSLHEAYTMVDAVGAAAVLLAEYRDR